MAPTREPHAAHARMDRVATRETATRAGARAARRGARATHRTFGAHSARLGGAHRARSRAGHRAQPARAARGVHGEGGDSERRLRARARQGEVAVRRGAHRMKPVGDGDDEYVERAPRHERRRRCGGATSARAPLAVVPTSTQDHYPRSRAMSCGRSDEMQGRLMSRASLSKRANRASAAPRSVLARGSAQGGCRPATATRHRRATGALRCAAHTPLNPSLRVGKRCCGAREAPVKCTGTRNQTLVCHW